MTVQSSVMLFGAMVFLAALPSTSVFAVLIRSTTAGLRHGLLVSLGIVIADLVFVAVAIYGLTMLVKAIGDWWVLLVFLGGCYLCWLGWMSLQAKPQQRQQTTMDSSYSASFLAGFLITIADQKAIVFYLSFFPAFLDVSVVTFADTLIIFAITFLAVGGVKCLYALFATQVYKKFQNSAADQWLYRIAGVFLICVGVFLVFRVFVIY